MKYCSPILVVFCLAVLLTPTAAAQGRFEPNYDESKVPAYTLPDPLVTRTGEKVTDAETWRQVRRPELLELFKTHVYGRSPEPCPIRSEVVSTKEDALGGKALRREVDVFFGESPDAHSMGLLIYTPKGMTSAPAFLGLNFQGNHTIDSDPTISITDSWVRNRGNGTTEGNRATEGGRGVASDRWPVETIVDRGYGLVTIYYGDIDPDYDDGFENGIHGEFKDWASDIPKGERWGSIAAWAYGLGRALDYLQQDLRVDGSRVAVIGHSRLGKTSLWAGASDPRFKLVISNDSGCGGAALSRRAFGETVGRINTSFPHWFCDNFNQYNQNESALPVDQHQLIALVAPRAVYVASATGDPWADPRGEFLSAVHAAPVFRLLGTDGFGGTETPRELPPPDEPINDGTIGYHLRTGKHDLTEYDWRQYLNFADRHL